MRCINLSVDRAFCTGVNTSNTPSFDLRRQDPQVTQLTLQNKHSANSNNRFSALLLPAVLSVRLSVCPSITLLSHAYAVQDVEINFTPYGRAMFLIS